MIIQLIKVMDMPESGTLLKVKSMTVHIKNEPDIAFTKSCKDEYNSGGSQVFYN